VFTVAVSGVKEFIFWVTPESTEQFSRTTVMWQWVTDYGSTDAEGFSQQRKCDPWNDSNSLSAEQIVVSVLVGSRESGERGKQVCR